MNKLGEKVMLTIFWGVRAADLRRPKLQEPNLVTLEKSHYE